MGGAGRNNDGNGAAAEVARATQLKIGHEQKEYITASISQYVNNASLRYIPNIQIYVYTFIYANIQMYIHMYVCN